MRIAIVGLRKGPSMRRRNEGEKNNQRKKKGNKLVFRKSGRNARVGKKAGKGRMNN